MSFTPAQLEKIENHILMKLGEYGCPLCKNQNDQEFALVFDGVVQDSHTGLQYVEVTCRLCGYAMRFNAGNVQVV